MPDFEVRTAEGDPVQVRSANWLAALGDGLQALGQIANLERLACEVLPNGRVVARDVRTGQGFVVMQLGQHDGVAVDVLPARGRHEDESSESAFAQPGDDEDVEDAGTPLGEPLSSLTDDLTDPYSPPTSLTPEAVSSTTRLVVDLVDRVRRAPSALLAWHEALDASQALVPSEAGAALEREADGRLRFLYAFGPRSSGVQGAVLPAGVGIAGFAVERVASVLVQDTQNDDRFCSDFDEVTGFRTSSVICVPVAYEGTVFGCLELLNPLLPGGYDRGQMELVEMVVDSLAGRLARER